MMVVVIMVLVLVRLPNSMDVRVFVYTERSTEFRDDTGEAMLV
jgi:hypothetical protein